MNTNTCPYIKVSTIRKEMSKILLGVTVYRESNCLRSPHISTVVGFQLIENLSYPPFQYHVSVICNTKSQHYNHYTELNVRTLIIRFSKRINELML